MRALKKILVFVFLVVGALSVATGRDVKATSPPAPVIFRKDWNYSLDKVVYYNDVFYRQSDAQYITGGEFNSDLRCTSWNDFAVVDACWNEKASIVAWNDYTILERNSEYVVRFYDNDTHAWTYDNMYLYTSDVYYPYATASVQAAGYSHVDLIFSISPDDFEVNFDDGNGWQLVGDLPFSTYEDRQKCIAEKVCRIEVGHDDSKIQIRQIIENGADRTGLLANENITLQQDSIGIISNGYIVGERVEYTFDDTESCDPDSVTWIGGDQKSIIKIQPGMSVRKGSIKVSGLNKLAGAIFDLSGFIDQDPNTPVEIRTAGRNHFRIVGWNSGSYMINPLDIMLTVDTDTANGLWPGFDGDEQSLYYTNVQTNRIMIQMSTILQDFALIYRNKPIISFSDGAISNDRNEYSSALQFMLKSTFDADPRCANDETLDTCWEDNGALLGLGNSLTGLDPGTVFYFRYPADGALAWASDKIEVAVPEEEENDISVPNTGSKFKFSVEEDEGSKASLATYSAVVVLVVSLFGLRLVLRKVRK